MSSTSFVIRRSARLAAKTTSTSNTSITPNSPKTTPVDPGTPNTDPVNDLRIQTNAILPRLERDTITVEQSRKIFAYNQSSPVFVDPIYKFTCNNTIRSYMNSIAEARGKLARAVLFTALNRYILQNPQFLAVHPPLYKTVLEKMEEFLRGNPVPDAIIDAELRTSAKNLVYVITSQR